MRVASTVDMIANIITDVEFSWMGEFKTVYIKHIDAKASAMEILHALEERGMLIQDWHESPTE